MEFDMKHSNNNNPQAYKRPSGTKIAINNSKIPMKGALRSGPKMIKINLVEGLEEGWGWIR